MQSFVNTELEICAQFLPINKPLIVLDHRIDALRWIRFVHGETQSKGNSLTLSACNNLLQSLAALGFVLGTNECGNLLFASSL
jgi:hypothetical protein